MGCNYYYYCNSHCNCLKIALIKWVYVYIGKAIVQTFTNYVLNYVKIRIKSQSAASAPLCEIKHSNEQIFLEAKQ